MRRLRLSMTEILWLAVLVVLALAALFFAVRGFGIGGGDSFSPASACDRPLAPLGQSEISTAEFKTVELGLAQVVEAARAGDVQTAQRLFFGPVHNFTHNVDPPLRAKNPALAKTFCETIVRIEIELASERRPERIATEMENARQILGQIAEALFLTR